MGAGRYVGRVGALAVALGVGFGVSSAVTVAMADTSSSPGSPSNEASRSDARRAGAPDAVSLLARMGVDDVGQLVWRVELRHLGDDDRVQRRADADLDEAAIDDLRARLDRLDRRAGEPWTRTTLRLIERYPGIVSTALARHAGKERQVFKTDVRKLKELGLTESLEVGYRLSPRGEAVLRALG